MAPPRFPHLFAAMQDAALLVAQRWQEHADRMLQTPGERQAYADGITLGPVTEGPGGLTTVVRNRWRPARRIEEGYGPYHLPDVINWGRARSAHLNKRGRAYMIIPFRHYAGRSAAHPGRTVMPAAVYTAARSLRPDQMLTAGPGTSSIGGRHVHVPGLQPYVPRFARNIRPGYTPAAIQEGLRRVPRGKKSVQYLTFRTMTQNSAGWWIPGKAANPIAATTVRAVAPEVHKLLTDAARQDVVDLVSITVGQQRMTP